MSSRIAYFEQLALLRFPSARIYAPAFALAAALELAETGHRHMFMTVVRSHRGLTGASPGHIVRTQ